MQQEGVHIEFSITGLSKDALAGLFTTMWEFVEPALPIISGAWGLQQTLYFSAAIAGAALLARLIRYLSEGETSGERVPDSLGVKAALIHEHSPESAQRAMLSAHPRSGAATNTSGVSNEVSKVVSLVLHVTHRSVGFISRMGLNYLVLSLLVCVFFGTGDLQLLALLFGIGG